MSRCCGFVDCIWYRAFSLQCFTVTGRGGGEELGPPETPLALNPGHMRRQWLAAWWPVLPHKEAVTDILLCSIPIPLELASEAPDVPGPGGSRVSGLPGF